MTEPTTETGGCDTCGATPPHGGRYDYTDQRGRARHGCIDDRACATTYARLSQPERNVLDRARRAL